MAHSSINNKFFTLLLLTNTSLVLASEVSEPEKIGLSICEDQDSDKDCQHSNFQTLIVTSRKTPFAGLKPTTQSTSTIEISNHVKVPSTLTELIEGIPGVAENSQPGLYQVISIRGVSRQRILSIVDGVRLNSERRAGVAASFIDPLLLDNVQVIRGPISTYYGSGAIGGVTQMHFRNHEGLDTAVGYKNLGNEQFQSIHWGDESSNAALVKRQANNSQDIQSNPLNTHFEQTAGYLQNSWLLDNSVIDSWLFSSYGSDIGRSNSRFPDRVINIPQEKHTIFKTSITSEDKWSLDLYLHDQSITTNTLRPEDSISEVISKSLDFGISAQTAWEQINQSNLVGVDFYTRRNVNINEQKIDLRSAVISNNHTLNNGQLDELALFYTYHKQINDFRFQLGGRYTVEKIDQHISPNETNTALTGFAGIAYEVSQQIEINANIGNAFRFASLTERFFSGTTARGDVTGNPDLKAEKAMTYDLGFNWQSEHQKIKATFFLSNFDDYVERIELAQDSLTFVNREDGRIKGLEAEYDWMITERLDLSLVATLIDGKNSQDQNLADIPSDRVSLSLNYQTAQWYLNFRLQHRAGKNDPGNGEVATQSANILAASISYQFDPKWNFRIYADNLLDETYVSSADDLATLAAGRNFGLTISWQQN